MEAKGEELERKILINLYKCEEHASMFFYCNPDEGSRIDRTGSGIQQEGLVTLSQSADF
jgi:hypothetical protein